MSNDATQGGMLTRRQIQSQSAASGTSNDATQGGMLTRRQIQSQSAASGMSNPRGNQLPDDLHAARDTFLARDFGSNGQPLGIGTTGQKYLNGVVHQATLKRWVQEFGRSRDHAITKEDLENGYSESFQSWVAFQRKWLLSYEVGTNPLHDKWYEELIGTGFRWDDRPQSITFEGRLEQLRNFFVRYGQAPMDRGDDDAPQGLGGWLVRQRSAARTNSLTPAQILAIRSILGPDWINPQRGTRQRGPRKPKDGRPKED